MRLLKFALALLLAAFSSAVNADYVIRDSSGALLTIKSYVLPGGIHVPQSVSTDTTGVPLFSSSNVGYVRLPDQRATGQTINAATLNAAVSIALLDNKAVTAFSVTGLTGTGATLTIEASPDGGATWNAVNGVTPATGAVFSTLTTNQDFRVNTGGRTDVRLRVSTIGTGTITVAYNASSSSSLVALSSPIPAGTNSIGAVTATFQGSVGAGTAGTTSALIGCVFSSSLPTLSNGQQAAAQCDSAGRLLTTGNLPAQGSTTSGQTGPLIQGAVTTAAPTYTNGQTSPFSLDTGGNVRMNCVSGCSGASSVGTVGSAVPANAGFTGAVSSGNLVGIIQADASAKIDVATATTTQIVALSASKKIYVTSFDVIAGGTGNIKFVYGTGSACGTGTTDLTASYQLVAQAGIAKGNGLGTVLVVPASNALCVTTSAAVQMSGSISYTQF
jgi:hypothetical protein